MNKSAHKVVLVAAWIVVVFGYLYFLQFAYDKEKSFHLFVFVAIAGNLAYDGLKSVLKYEPLYPSDASTTSKYVMGFVASLAGSLAFLLIGAELFVYRILGNTAAQIVSGVGFLSCISAGMWLLAKAETHFKGTNHA